MITRVMTVSKKVMMSMQDGNFSQFVSCNTI